MRLLFDPELLSGLADPRPTNEDTTAETEWAARHWTAAWRSASRDFGERSMELYSALLAGQSVADVARRFSMSTQAVHKVKQRMTRRLRELVARSIENERKAR